MPKMTYVKGVGYVRAGSWSTKPLLYRWQHTLRQLKDADLLVPRLDGLLFDDGARWSQTPAVRKVERDLSESMREYEEERIIWQLEALRDQINSLLGKFPQARRLKALENVTGRTPEEAASFRAKAEEIRRSMNNTTA